MFARKVAARLKPDSLKEFTFLMQLEILPWLKRQKGFLDLIVFASTDSAEVAALSFWDHRENAQAYNSHGYPEVLNRLGQLFDGVPYVKTFDVVASTLQRVEFSATDEVKELIEQRAASSDFHVCETDF